MIGMNGKTLHSADLTFRLACEEDKPAIYSILQDEAVSIPAGALPIRDEAAMDAFWSGLTRYQSCVAILLGEQCIGYIHVGPHVPQGQTERDGVSLGFMIGAAWHRRGFATQTLHTLCDYLRPRFGHIWAEVFEENTASRRTLQKCGFVPVDAYDRAYELLGGESKHTILHLLQ